MPIRSSDHTLWTQVDAHVCVDSLKPELLLARSLPPFLRPKRHLEHSTCYVTCLVQANMPGHGSPVGPHYLQPCVRPDPSEAKPLMTRVRTGASGRRRSGGREDTGGGGQRPTASWVSQTHANIIKYLSSYSKCKEQIP